MVNSAARITSDWYPMPTHGWTCYFCGETLTTPGAARDHFGNDQFATSACQIKAGEERGLLMSLRRAEAELARYHDEDSDKDRQMANLRCEHFQALRRAEEDGYAKGLSDGKDLLSRECDA